VLILPDPDRFGIDLDQFGKRILEPPRNRHCPAQRYVELGQLLGRISRCRVHRGAGFGDHDLGRRVLRYPRNQLGGQSVGFPRRGPVADGDQLDAEPRDERTQRCHRFFGFVLRFVRIDHLGGDHLACPVDDRDFDSGPVSRVETHGCARTCGRGQQQITQVGCEYVDRILLGRLPQSHSNIDTETDLQLGSPCPTHRVQQPAVRGSPLVGNAEPYRDPPLVDAWLLVRRGRRAVRLRIEVQVQHLFLLTAQQGKDAM